MREEEAEACGVDGVRGLVEVGGVEDLDVCGMSDAVGEVGVVSGVG